MRELRRDRYRVWLPLREVWPRLLHRRGRHHQRHDSVDHHGSSNVCATMVDKSCTLYVSHHLGAWRVCEHNPNRAEGSEQWVQSVSSSTFEPAICIDNSFLEDLSINWQLGSEHLEDMCASPHTTSQAIEHMPQPAPEASFRVQSSEAKGASCGTI